MGNSTSGSRSSSYKGWGWNRPVLSPPDPSAEERSRYLREVRILCLLFLLRTDRIQVPETGLFLKKTAKADCQDKKRKDKPKGSVSADAAREER